jgi:hypothetical protein
VDLVLIGPLKGGDLRHPAWPLQVGSRQPG